MIIGVKILCGKYYFLVCFRSNKPFGIMSILIVDRNRIAAKTVLGYIFVDFRKATTLDDTESSERAVSKTMPLRS